MNARGNLDVLRVAGKRSSLPSCKRAIAGLTSKAEMGVSRIQQLRDSDAALGFQLKTLGGYSEKRLVLHALAHYQAQGE